MERLNLFPRSHRLSTPGGRVLLTPTPVRVFYQTCAMHMLQRPRPLPWALVLAMLATGIASECEPHDCCDCCSSNDTSPCSHVARMHPRTHFYCSGCDLSHATECGCGTYNYCYSGAADFDGDVDPENPCAAPDDSSYDDFEPAVTPADWTYTNAGHRAALIFSLAGLPLLVIGAISACSRSRKRAKLVPDASSVIERDAMAQLHDASRAAWQIRMRVTGTLLYLAWVCLIIGIHSFVLMRDTNMDMYAEESAGYASFVNISLVLMLNAVLPKDARIIRYGLCPAFIVIPLGLTAFLLLTYAPVLENAIANSEFQSGAELHQSLQLLVNVSLSIPSIGACLTSVFALARKSSPRRTLNLLFRALQIVFMWVFLGYLIVGLTSLLVEDPQLAQQDPDRARAQRAQAVRRGTQALALSGSALVSMVFTSPHLRSVLRCRLASLNLHAEAQNAAAVAALIGAQSAKDIFPTAVANLRALTVESLTYDDFSGNQATDNGQQLGKSDLNAKTQPMQFGAVDAFLSHSWRDDAQAKWQALQEWRTGIEKQRELPATIWFECAKSKVSNPVRERPNCLPHII
jgi:hypothetical protein